MTALLPLLLDDGPEPPAVGYGCANPHCDGIAYFPSKPDDYCTRCQSDATDAARGAASELSR